MLVCLHILDTSYFIVVCRKKVRMQRCKFRYPPKLSSNAIFSALQLEFHLCLNTKVIKKQEFFFFIYLDKWSNQQNIMLSKIMF